MLASQELTQGRAGTSIWPLYQNKNRGDGSSSYPGVAPEDGLFRITLVGIFNSSRSKSIIMIASF